MKSAYPALMWASLVTALLFTITSDLSAGPSTVAAQRVSTRRNTPPPPKSDSLTTSLRGAISDGIKLLANNENEAFLRRFIPPEQLSNFLSDSTFGDLVEGFTTVKATELLNVLRYVQKRQPKFVADDGQTVATYTFSAKINRHKKLKFLYIEGAWYIGN